MSVRWPYVGDGVEGMLRSLQIDLEEADCYDVGDPRRDRALASARDWQERILSGG